ncbi:MAG TPA: transglycosylase SLT domain-containing protein [Thermopolyspora sp.]|jgi:Transglycosylase SLT domain.
MADLEEILQAINVTEAPRLNPVAHVRRLTRLQDLQRAEHVNKVRQARWRAMTPKLRNKSLAFRLVSERSWSNRQFRCLDRLWTRESNWNHHAVNRSSGAYGIPQALPASKMRGAGRDWRINPETQIKWGLKYIKSRYGKPCTAWAHSRAHGWY